MTLACVRNTNAIDVKPRIRSLPLAGYLEVVDFVFMHATTVLRCYNFDSDCAIEMN